MNSLEVPYSRSFHSALRLELTDAQQIIVLLQQEDYSYRSIARSCGLSKSLIGKLANKERVRIETLRQFEAWIEREFAHTTPQPVPQIAAPGPEYIDADYHIEEYTEQPDPYSNSRVRVPYPSRALVPYSPPQPYQGPSRYLASPQTYHREVQQERAEAYRYLRHVRQPRYTMQPRTSADGFLTMLGRALDAFLALQADSGM